MEIPKSFKPKKNSEKNLKELLKPRRKKTASDIYKKLLDYKKLYEPKDVIQTYEFIYEEQLDLLLPIVIDKKGLLWKPEYETREHDAKTDANIYLNLSDYGGNYIHHVCKIDPESVIVGYNINGWYRKEHPGDMVSLGIEIKHNYYPGYHKRETALTARYSEMVEFYKDFLENIVEELEKIGYYIV